MSHSDYLRRMDDARDAHDPTDDILDELDDAAVEAWEANPPIHFCYMGHADCWDNHEVERRTDEADWEAEDSW